MLYQKSFPFRQIGFLGFAILSFTISAFALLQQSESSWGKSRHHFPRPAIGLEIISPHKSTPLFKGTSTSCLLNRNSLFITDQEAAKDFTAVYIVGIAEKEGLKIRLSILYNELSEQGWKNKQEKEIGNFTILAGNSLSPLELLQFGIEPFEIKVISNKHVVLKPEEYPRLFNFTNLLEVVEVEKSIDGYRFSFKNISNKKIIAFELWSGNSGKGGGGLISGEIFEEINSFAAPDIEKYGLALKMILFEDRTYEGDAKSATRYFARWEGEAVQAAKLLPMIEGALQVSDAELSEVFDKLEAQLWKMQEAMDKSSALEFLKIKYSNFDDKTISMLYEEFKGGFYSARNAALSPMGTGKRQLQEQGEKYLEADKIRLIRHTLSQAKSHLEKLVSASRER
jgi:hypothetical protein